MVLIVAGVLLLAVELFVVPGSIWAGLAGGIAILAGLIWSFAAGSGALEYELGRRILVDEAFRVVLAALVVDHAQAERVEILGRWSAHPSQTFRGALSGLLVLLGMGWSTHPEVVRTLAPMMGCGWGR